MATAPDNRELPAVVSRFDLAILAKAPIADYAKTRLIPLLGSQGAADLQDWLIQKTVASGVSSGFRKVALWCSPDCAHSCFAHCRDDLGVSLYAQPEGDLGARMLLAARLGAESYGTVIVGTDCPTLTSEDLALACQEIVAGNDAVAIPAEDGGYVLIAMRHAYPELFSEIDWGTSRVMEQTRERAYRAGIRLVELPPKWDVDVPDDYWRLESAYPEVRQTSRLPGGRQNETALEAACR